MSTVGSFAVSAAPASESRLMPTIALVDDDRNILTSVSIALEAEGYRITGETIGPHMVAPVMSAGRMRGILDNE